MEIEYIFRALLGYIARLISEPKIFKGIEYSTSEKYMLHKSPFHNSQNIETTHVHQLSKR